MTTKQIFIATGYRFLFPTKLTPFLHTFDTHASSQTMDTKDDFLPLFTFFSDSESLIVVFLLVPPGQNNTLSLIFLLSDGYMFS